MYDYREGKLYTLYLLMVVLLFAMIIGIISMYENMQRDMYIAEQGIESYTTLESINDTVYGSNDDIVAVIEDNSTTKVYYMSRKGTVEPIVDENNNHLTYNEWAKNKLNSK